MCSTHWPPQHHQPGCVCTLQVQQLILLKLRARRDLLRRMRRSLARRTRSLDRNRRPAAVEGAASAAAATRRRAFHSLEYSGRPCRRRAHGDTLLPPEGLGLTGRARAAHATAQRCGMMSTQAQAPLASGCRDCHLLCTLLALALILREREQSDSAGIWVGRDGRGAPRCTRRGAAAGTGGGVRAPACPRGTSSIACLMSDASSLSRPTHLAGTPTSKLHTRPPSTL